jgi:ABC-type uncharacterized transport system permease subunit
MKRGSGHRIALTRGIFLLKISSWVLTIVGMLVLPCVLLAISGHNPFDVLWKIVNGSLGSWSGIAASLEKSTPFIVAGLGATVAFTCGIWNLGIQGQILIGALGTVLVGLYLPGLPRPLLFPIMFLVTFIFGGAWALLPAFLRQKFRVNELVSSLLFNYVAYWLIVYLVRYPLHGEKAFGSTTDSIGENAYLPGLVSGGPFARLNVSFIVVLATGVILWFVFRKTLFGYRVRAVGTNTSASFLAGIPVNRVIILVMFISGGIAGLAGLTEVAGTHHVLVETIAINYGFFGIAAALLGKMRPIPVLLVAIGIGCLWTGGLFVQAATGISSNLVLLIIACVLIGVLFQPVLERLLVRLIGRRKEGATGSLPVLAGLKQPVD